MPSVHLDFSLLCKQAFGNKLISLESFVFFKQLHVQNGKILPTSSHQHFLSDAALANYSTTLSSNLLDRDTLKAVSKR